ncbi:monovalent cation/H(+) antiporter subunit G [Kytococcus sedentarius]|uniref:Monovalent cation/proton antiporter, MnhG/PhaG subunit n=1 Tax=Kytococcus sedentarius (strain ATCC 14392 / DSM 20547 / JCM 11482 / CCUG 33030 / NBRC 15357 / NCTC 11040 / CCM 314 / 541) TaxID=478801 RepID=C7NIQ2_KYTSD|nr:monovalent cation/H(+) antiporter subunit G [Kytococcus sedentarius]ACV06690.1 monovalent cation/proton antiporter, MnhG/PhaG subunit [Kytococcus sedentarius DSM 20547]QQB64974.1 monovalent cation/H(+) antiporter subunit G [Kytococcus sedentarius]STX14495.1 Multiple resistance and pH homeostasis protein G [Kytococcus sedentarius]
MNDALQIAGASFLLVGALLSLVAGIGLVRFPDVLTRMHAATKPQTMGLVLMAIGFGLVVREWPVWGALVLAVLFQFLTAPVAAHMIGRGALRTGQVRLPLYEDPGVSADARDDD